MNQVIMSLPVYVFFDKEGSVISFKYPEKDFLYGLSTKEFEQVTQSFTPVHPSPKIAPPSLFSFPVKAFLNDEGRIYHLKLSGIEKIYGKNQEQVAQIAEQQQEMLEKV